MKILALVILVILLIATEGFSQNIQQREPEVKIIFNDSAATYVLMHPADALIKERDSIWRTFGGYQITLTWHKESSFPVGWEIWEKGLNRFLYKDTSLIRKSLDLAHALRSKVQGEKNKIVSHISSYVGEKTDFNAYVYFVAFTIPYAFCVEQNKIGIDITADEWYFDVDCVLNTAIHEIYHVGFRINSPDNKYREKDPVDKTTFLRFNYAYMQSEGMATYVGYKALKLFPSNFRHDDYKLLEEDIKVKKAIGQINTLIAMSKKVAADSLNKESWKIGVSERAYYVAGAYMAKRIEENFGTRYLAELVNKGSLQFVKDYNAIVPGEYRISLVE